MPRCSSSSLYLPLRLTAVVFLILCASSFAIAQNTNSGEIRGTVSDPTGAVLPGATITILNVDTGVSKELTTNQSGIYDAVSILPGTYKITFRAKGFNDFVRDGITLQVQTLTINAQLTVGAAQQQVEVTAEAPMLKTETAEQSTTFDAKTLINLPNVGQDWGNYTKILPGAVGSGTGVAVNGNLPFYANFLADGASTTLPHSGNTDTSILETMSELQVQTSTYSAQYGIGGAAFNQISKGGTNEFHGAAYEYLRNNFFDAREFFSPDAGNLRYHNFGGSAGGPILKNKLFFYFNVDKTINNSHYFQFDTVPTTGTFGTVNMRAGQFNSPDFPTIYNPVTRQPFPNNTINIPLDPVALKIQNVYPEPNLPGYTNNWQGVLTSSSPALKYFGRLDYNLPEKNRLTFSITERDARGTGTTFDYPWDAGFYDIASVNAQVSDVWTLSPNIINEFRLGFTRQGNWFYPKTLGQGVPQALGLQYAKADVAPSVSISGTCCTGIGPSTNAIYVENSFDPSDVVTMIRGRHILKFGGELLAYQDNSTPWGNINAANFTFSGVFTQSAPFGTGGLGYADFLLGQVDSWNASNTPIVGMRQKSPQLFVQDDFKLRPNLTLNLGLRYQIQGGWHEVANRIGAFDPTIINPLTNTPGAVWFAPNNGRSSIQSPIHNIFLPRVGFAWSAMNNLVVRGGFGIYSYNWTMDTYADNAKGLGTNSQGSLSQTDQVAPVFILSDPNPPLNYITASRDPGAYNGQSVNYYPYHTPIARNYQWSFSLQRQLPHDMLAEAAYVGSHTTGLYFPGDINQVPPNLLAQSAATGNGQDLRPYPQFQTINGSRYNAIANYNSLQLSLTKRFTAGLQFDVNYTFSKMLDDQDSSGYGAGAGSQPYQDAYDPSLNYGPSNFDVRHMFKGDVVYQLPFGKGRAYMNQGGLLDAVVGGWQASMIFVLQSGQPFTPLVGGSNNSGALSGSWYPNLIGDPNVSHPTIQEWFNPCTLLSDGTTDPAGCTNPAWAVPAPGTFGNAGRNILRGPRLVSFDFSMGKSFRFPLPDETGELQIRVDAQNVFNHANFGQPDQNVGVGSAGIINYTTGPRIIQLGARLSF
ncbi:MAG: carboxypeptidase regulatory-like domain-containing protein [Bryobacteraceae bacterium]